LQTSDYQQNIRLIDYFNKKPIWHQRMTAKQFDLFQEADLVLHSSVALFGKAP
jgi:hypothetical protein